MLRFGLNVDSKIEDNVMRNLIVLLMMSIAAAAMATSVDDFQSYSVGDLQLPWNSTDGTAEIIGGATYGEQYLATADCYALLSDLGLADVDSADTQTTVFFRTMTEDTSANCTFGVDDTAGDGGWDNEYYIQWNEGDLQVRDSSGGEAVVEDAEAGVWYNVWFVINNSANTYQVYVNTGTANATTSDEVSPDDGTWNPRGGSSDTLKAFNSQGWSTYIYVDDIHVWPGEANLTNPAKSAVAPVEDELSGIVGDMTDSVTNNSFELPGTGYINDSWDSIDGWTSIVNPPTDSGVQTGGANDTDYHGYVGDVDDPAYQITSEVIEAGKSYTLEVQMKSSWQAESGEIALFYLTDDSDPNTMVILAETEQTGLDSDWVTVTTSFTASSAGAEVGKNLGILLDCLDGDGESFTAFDEIVLCESVVFGPTDLSPELDEEVAPGTTSLTWTPSNDPNVAAQELVYYVGDLIDYPDVSSYVSSSTTVALGASDDSYDLELLNDQGILWRIDTVVDANSFATTTYTGATTGFTTQPTDKAPIVTAGSGWLTYVGGPMPTLSADVNDFGEGDIAEENIVWSVDIPWEPMDDTICQMYYRGTVPVGVDEPDMLQDWIGSDARADDAWIYEPLVITISGVPSGSYDFVSYHYDSEDQSDEISVVIIDANGESDAVTVDQANGEITSENPLVTFETTVVSDGGDIQIVVDNLGGNFSMLNGFVLGDIETTGLAIDFGTEESPVEDGWQAYTATHEDAASFVEQTYDALGVTGIGVVADWGPGALGKTATVTKDDTVDPLATTATFFADTSGDYTVTITATDTNGPLGDQTDSDTLVVRIAPNACSAAVSWGGGSYAAGDFDKDCDVDLDDLKTMATEWLTSTALSSEEATAE